MLAILNVIQFIDKVYLVTSASSNEQNCKRQGYLKSFYWIPKQVKYHLGIFSLCPQIVGKFLHIKIQNILNSRHANQETSFSQKILLDASSWKQNKAWNYLLEPIKRRFLHGVFTFLIKQAVNKLGLSCAKFSLASAKLHTSLKGPCHLLQIFHIWCI